LGSEFTATDKEIKDSLWYYFFDVEKTVTYIKSTTARIESALGKTLMTRIDQKKPASPKKAKPKQVTRFDQAANAAQKNPIPIEGEQTFPHSGTQGDTCCPTCNHWNYCNHFPGALRPCHPSALPSRTSGSNTVDKVLGSYPNTNPQSSIAAFNLVNFFQDTPWGNVPQNRLATIEMVPVTPRGGLLGGSAKPSKLAALAAARKKKEEEKQATAEASQSGRSIALLDRLGARKENVGTSPVPSNIITVPTEKPNATRFQNRPKTATSPIESPPKPSTSQPPARQPAPEPAPDLRAKPSVFAQTMFGQRTPAIGGVLLQEMEKMDLDPPAPRQEGSMFTLPYINDPDFAARNPFSGPSPDDVVLRAQNKGSAHV
jgi:elongation factor 1 alpha-like protein